MVETCRAIGINACLASVALIGVWVTTWPSTPRRPALPGPVRLLDRGPAVGERPRFARANPRPRDRAGGEHNEQQPRKRPPAVVCLSPSGHLAVADGKMGVPVEGGVNE